MALGHALAADPAQIPNEAGATAEAAYSGTLAKLFEDPQALTKRHQQLFEFALKMFLDGVALRRATPRATGKTAVVEE